MAPTNAQIVLDAVQAAIDANVSHIHALTQQHKLKAGLVLRILLTFLPESTDPRAHVSLLRDLNGEGTGLPESLAEFPDDKVGHEQRTPEEAKRRVRDLRLLPLHVPDEIQPADGDTLSPSLTKFLLIRARRIDHETGNLPLVQQLLDPFIEQSSYLKLWAGSIILPLLRLNYELFPNREEAIPLAEFENLRGGSALDTLIGGGIGGSTTADDYVRDLKQVVAPWLYGEIYRRRHRIKRSAAASEEPEQEECTPLVCWAWVNNWMMHIASKSPSMALAIAGSSTWHGPGDVDDGGWIGDDFVIMNWIWGHSTKADSTDYVMTSQAYFRTCLSLVYIVADSSPKTLDSLEELLLKVADSTSDARYIRTILSGERQGDARVSVLPVDFLQKVHATSNRMQPVDLLENSHPLTSLQADSLALGAHLLRTARALSELKQSMPVSRILHMSSLGTANEQRVLLQRVLQNFENKKNTDDDCEEMRTKLLHVMLRPQSSDQARPYGVLAKIWIEDRNEFDVLVLKAEINSARYRHAIMTYVSGNSQRLSLDKVEDTAVSVALAAYDNATNGNRTRGGVKKAADIVAAFKKVFSESKQLSQIEALIRSTHALSFYKLTLQHGVLCTPASIRVHQQPLALIDKVLAQNPQSYAQLDNMISIGVDFVRAGIVTTPFRSDPEIGSVLVQEAQEATIAREIITKAISAALEEGDFDTAYSYITARLSSHIAGNDDDDILWRAAYAAGKNSPPTGTSSQQLRRLEQKMELLSQALALAPPSALTEVLSTWRECETQVNEALATETEAEERWNEQGDKRAISDRHLPGGFGSEAFIPNADGSGGRQTQGGRGRQEEAPMGLFDVARAAGSALQKSAFPLRATGQAQGSHAGANVGGVDDESYIDGQRVRKRDMVSNAVTSGLVSGIGWVIGEYYTSVWCLLSLALFGPVGRVQAWKMVLRAWLE